MIKAPNKFSRDFQHRAFGIDNWLRGQQIFDAAIQKEILDLFLSDNGFVAPTNGKKAILRAKSAFMQNRFNKFCDFALKYKKENGL